MYDNQLGQLHVLHRDVYGICFLDLHVAYRSLAFVSAGNVGHIVNLPCCVVTQIGNTSTSGSRYSFKQ